MILHTYLNDAELKRAFLAEITKHEEADALIKGSYGKMNGSFKGCAIGCSLHSLNVLQGKIGKESLLNTGLHSRYESELGLPIWFAYLEDHLFENLPDELAKTWPRRLAEAIPVGAVVDDIVLAKILRWSLADADFGVRYATDNEEVRGWIDIQARFFEAEIAGGADDELSATSARAARAACWAARAAWDARAAWAAWAARDARAAWAAWDARAAWAAWDARDARAARAARDARAASLIADSPTSVATQNKADLYYPALSEYVIRLMREL